MKPLVGRVVSNKMMKSVTVMVERIFRHPRWNKYMKTRKKYMVRTILVAGTDVPAAACVESTPPRSAFLRVTRSTRQYSALRLWLSKQELLGVGTRFSSTWCK